MVVGGGIFILGLLKSTYVILKALLFVHRKDSIELIFLQWKCKRLLFDFVALCYIKKFACHILGSFVRSILMRGNLLHNIASISNWFNWLQITDD